MADSPFRNQPIRQLSLVVTVCGAMAGLILVAAGVYGLITGATGTPAILFVAGLMLLTVSLFLYAILDVILHVDDGIDRIRLGLMGLYLRRQRDGSRYESITAKEWVRRLGELGILNPASRTQQGARLYRPEDVARFAAQREEARARRASKTP